MAVTVGHDVHDLAIGDDRLFQSLREGIPIRSSKGVILDVTNTSSCCNLFRYIIKKFRDVCLMRTNISFFLKVSLGIPFKSLIEVLFMISLT